MLSSCAMRAICSFRRSAWYARTSSSCPLAGTSRSRCPERRLPQARREIARALSHGALKVASQVRLIRVPELGGEGRQRRPFAALDAQGDLLQAIPADDSFRRCAHVLSKEPL